MRYVVSYVIIDTLVVKIRLFRFASLPQKDICQGVENDIYDDHKDDIGPKIALVKVVTVQNLSAFGETR